MTRRFTRLAWTAATFTYLLIILGAIVRITGSGLGCGDDWPLCHGRLLPPLEVAALIEFAHRQAVVLVTVFVMALAIYAWHLRRVQGNTAPSRAAYVALALLGVQVALGAVIVKLALPPLRVVLHLAIAMLILAALLVAARGHRLTPSSRPGLVGTIALVLAFVTVLFGALTANLGAASACLGFPLCNGQLAPTGNYLQHIHWAHRLLAYTLFAYVVWWAVRSQRRGAWYVVGLVTLQVAVAAAMVLLALPQPLQAAHVAVGAAVWAGLVLAVL
jgi:heme a synthase